MVKRKIVSIDEKKCNGCGLCLSNCSGQPSRKAKGSKNLIHKEVLNVLLPM